MPLNPFRSLPRDYSFLCARPCCCCRHNSSCSSIRSCSAILSYWELEKWNMHLLRYRRGKGLRQRQRQRRDDKRHPCHAVWMWRPTIRTQCRIIIIIIPYFIILLLCLSSIPVICLFVTQEVFLKAVPSELGMNETYQTIVTYTAAVLFTFLPLILLATFNCFLIAAVHNSTKLRRNMTNSRKVSSIVGFVTLVGQRH